MISWSSPELTLQCHLPSLYLFIHSGPGGRMAQVLLSKDTAWPPPPRHPLLSRNFIGREAASRYRLGSYTSLSPPQESKNSRLPVEGGRSAGFLPAPPPAGAKSAPEQAGAVHPLPGDRRPQPHLSWPRSALPEGLSRIRLGGEGARQRKPSDELS